jgi:hypothetical protein
LRELTQSVIELYLMSSNWDDDDNPGLRSALSEKSPPLLSFTNDSRNQKRTFGVSSGDAFACNNPSVSSSSRYLKPAGNFSTSLSSSSRVSSSGDVSRKQPIVPGRSLSINKPPTDIKTKLSSQSIIIDNKMHDEIVNVDSEDETSKYHSNNQKNSIGKSASVSRSSARLDFANKAAGVPTDSLSSLGWNGMNQPPKSTYQHKKYKQPQLVTVLDTPSAVILNQASALVTPRASQRSHHYDQMQEDVFLEKEMKDKKLLNGKQSKDLSQDIDKSMFFGDPSRSMQSSSSSSSSKTVTARVGRVKKPPPEPELIDLLDDEEEHGLENDADFRKMLEDHPYFPIEWLTFGEYCHSSAQGENDGNSIVLTVDYFPDKEDLYDPNIMISFSQERKERIPFSHINGYE